MRLYEWPDNSPVLPTRQPRKEGRDNDAVVVDMINEVQCAT